MTDTKTAFQANDRIQYSDMANPGTEYIVVAVHDNAWSTYELRNVETGETEWTDGRQAGWKLLKKTLTPETAQTGNGATINMFSDRQAATIVEVNRNGKQIVIQRDLAQRTNQEADTFSPGGFAGHTETPQGQQWAYERNAHGARFTANWSAKRNRFFIGGPKGTSVTDGRHEHYDYNF